MTYITESFKKAGLPFMHMAPWDDLSVGEYMAMEIGKSRGRMNLVNMLVETARIYGVVLVFEFLSDDIVRFTVKSIK